MTKEIENRIQRESLKEGSQLCQEREKKAESNNGTGSERHKELQLIIHSFTHSLAQSITHCPSTWGTKRGQKSKQVKQSSQLQHLLSIASAQELNKNKSRLGHKQEISLKGRDLRNLKTFQAGVNTNILEISELKWRGMGKFNSDNHCIYYCGQESLRRNGVGLIVNRRVQNAVLGYNLKTDRMISVCFDTNDSTSL